MAKNKEDQRVSVDETTIRETSENPPGNGSRYLVFLAELGSKDHPKFDEFDAKACSEMLGC